MQLNVNYEELAKVANSLKESANYFEIELNNSKWILNLSSAEQLLLGDYIHSFKVAQSGCSEEEFKKCAEISGNYYRIDDFYSHEVETIKKELSAGFERYNIPFDINLTKEQAYEKYCGCDQETAKKAYDLINKINTEATNHEKDLREKYSGDLFVQLGKENMKAEYEEKARIQQEKFNEAAKELMQGPVGQLSEASQSIGNYGSFVNTVVGNYGTKNNDETGPRL